MSHYSVIKTIIKDSGCLVKALSKINNGRFNGKVEHHQTPVSLYGYQGDERPQKANVVLRRKHIGGSSNDIGFVEQADGTYQAIISEYDEHTYNRAWMDELTQRYSVETIVQTAEEQGQTAEVEEDEETGEIYVTCEGGY